MNLPVKIAQGVAKSPWAVVLSTLASIATLQTVFRDVLAERPAEVGSILALLGTCFVFIAIQAYSLVIRKENKNLKDIANIFREINSTYREALFTSFWNKNALPGQDDHLAKERATLHVVCQQISRIYSRLCGGVEFVVTVKLLTKESDAWYATTYTRSLYPHERDQGNRKKYEVDTGRNTGLDIARRHTIEGELSYFHSADLRKEDSYNNERSDYLKWYQSAIVVPIRCPQRAQRRLSYDYGFLCIDTSSRHKLNNKHHVVMLSALAEQMFNFMALMRKDYQINQGGPK